MCIFVLCASCASGLHRSWPPSVAAFAFVAFVVAALAFLTFTLAAFAFAAFAFLAFAFAAWAFVVVALAAAVPSSLSCPALVAFEVGSRAFFHPETAKFQAEGVAHNT